jgi:hypothetical protein
MAGGSRLLDHARAEKDQALAESKKRSAEFDKFCRESTLQCASILEQSGSPGAVEAADEMRMSVGEAVQKDPAAKVMAAFNATQLPQIGPSAESAGGMGKLAPKAGGSGGKVNLLGEFGMDFDLPRDPNMGRFGDVDKALGISDDPEGAGDGKLPNLLTRGSKEVAEALSYGLDDPLQTQYAKLEQAQQELKGVATEDKLDLQCEPLQPETWRRSDVRSRFR